MNNKLSIIIPCYNCEKTLEEAVESCYTQGLDDFEIVMVNDGSTDNTADILHKLSGKYQNIKIINHPINKGGGATRNTAVKNSSNEIIFCLDSDDILPPNTLSKMLSYIENKKCDGVAIHKSIKFNGVNIKDIERVDEFGYVNQQIPVGSLIEKHGEPLCPLYYIFMFTKKAWKVCGGYPEDHGFDTQGFAWRFLLNGLVAYTCPEASYLHRINFHKSYYIREYLSGKINLDWIKIITEFIPFITEEALDHINNYNINSCFFLIDTLKKYKNIFNNDSDSKILIPIFNNKRLYYIKIFKYTRENKILTINDELQKEIFPTPKCLKFLKKEKKYVFITSKRQSFFRKIKRKIFYLSYNIIEKIKRIFKTK
jgi:glycosyltransferase involved in cell wall biosynthesis